MAASVDSDPNSYFSYRLIVASMTYLLIFTLHFGLWLFIIFFILGIFIRLRARIRRRRDGTNKIAFFHPYCNAGGGGERVLWTAIRALQMKYDNVECFVYTGDNADGDDIIQRARQRFNIVIPKPVSFIYLSKRQFVEASLYPYFTLLGQSLGSMFLGWEALIKLVPDVYVDSMGYAFTLPIFRWLAGCWTVSYVHYPTISTDMLVKVQSRKGAHNNAQFVARSRVLSTIKLVYYQLFAFAYGFMGRRSDVTMVNSTWTLNHIREIWKARDALVVYPPCDTEEFVKLPDKRDERRRILSIGQFRPEKDHPLQVRSFSRFLKSRSEDDRDYQLVLAGSCRNEDDQERVDELQRLVEELGVVDNVVFELNISFEELKRHLSEATIGLHTMWNEHFGIGVVECMAAGTVVLAHDSGGPKLDIVVPQNDATTGYLASDEKSYADYMDEIFGLSKTELVDIVRNGRESCQRFSVEVFERGFLDCLEPLLSSIQRSH